MTNLGGKPSITLKLSTANQIGKISLQRLYRAHQPYPQGKKGAKRLILKTDSSYPQNNDDSIIIINIYI